MAEEGVTGVDNGVIEDGIAYRAGEDGVILVILEGDAVVG